MIFKIAPVATHILKEKNMKRFQFPVISIALDFDPWSCTYSNKNLVGPIILKVKYARSS